MQLNGVDVRKLYQTQKENNELLLKVKKLKEDLPLTASKFYKIRPKGGGMLIPLVFNEAQMKLHNLIEGMRARGNLVRVIVCKGRQQGISTYVCARFLHKAKFNPGVSVFILAHLGESTNYLFNMVKRMFYALPEGLRPSVDRSNRKELRFAELDSEYALGTAGSAAVGRGTTPQLLHLSEMAFYPNTDDLATGLMQGVATHPGTEVIIESTANGVNNAFYSLCMKGVDHNSMSRYTTLFIPWYIQKEYTETPPSYFRTTSREQGMIEKFGLTEGQVFWRRRKLEDDYNNDEWKFCQEYPLTLQEAFVTSGTTLLDGEKVAVARKYCGYLDTLAPMVMGVDGAGEGADRTALVVRQGRRIVEWEVYNEPVRPMRLAGIIAQKIDTLGLDMVFLDVAYGYGCRDRLAELGYGVKAMAIPFGMTPLMPELYKNKRAQMYGFMKEWFDEEGVSIPDDDMFVRDLMMIPGFELTTTAGLLMLPPKEKIRRDNDGVSPDISDALALTFAFPVKSRGIIRSTTVADIDTVRARSPFKSRRLSQKFVMNPQPSEFYVR